MTRTIILPVLIVFYFMLPGRLAARIDIPGTIAVFAVQNSGLQFNALCEKSGQTIIDTFDRLGRFLPLEQTRTQKILEDLPAGAGEEALLKAARELKADLFAIVTVNVEGNIIYGTVAIRSTGARYRNMQQDITVRSKVMMNIPLKLAREIALLHRDIPVTARVLEKRDGRFLLDAGQWHGLTPGRYRTAQGESITILNTNRFQSLAMLPASTSPSSMVTIQKYPSYKVLARELGGQIEYNTNHKYSLATIGTPGQNPEKKFTTGMCIVNPGANVCLPGYGSYLSTSYMGFKNTSPSVGGIIFSSLLIVTHFILPEAMTNFKINFVPGIMDRDKTITMNNLQIFCWATVPLTVSVAFLDQLAYQFKINEALPPFFMNRDETALALSIFIPGGGMFYKGYRLPGWSFYLSEMFLAGFCVYTKDSRKKVMYGGIALGGVKLIEFIATYFAPPSFNFFKFETEGKINPAALSMNIDPTETGDLVYKVGLTCSY